MILLKIIDDIFVFRILTNFIAPQFFIPAPPYIFLTAVPVEYDAEFPTKPFALLIPKLRSLPE